MDSSIVLNGVIKSGSWLKRNIRGTVIAADGGANACKKSGVAPSYVVGDFDSISKQTLSAFQKKSKFVRKVNQNQTDFQKALMLAQKLKVSRVFVFGGFGKDVDHEIANILSLNPLCVMLDERHAVRVVEKRLEISGTKGDVVSVIALSGVTGLSYSGLAWQAPKGKVPAGWIGVRNRFSKRNAVIALSSGRIAVITFTS